MYQNLIDQLDQAESEGGNAIVITQSSLSIISQGTIHQYGGLIDFWSTMFKIDPAFKMLVEEAIAISEVDH